MDAEPENKTPPLLTSEAARVLGVSPETIRLWERKGLLPAVKTDHGVRLFALDDVSALKRERDLRQEERAYAVAMFDAEQFIARMGGDR